MQSFKGREKARRYAMQALYGWLLSHNELNNIEKFCLADRNPKNYDVAYFIRLLHEIPAHMHDIHTDLTPHLDRPFDAIDPIELTILLVAGYELKYSVDIPFKVIIHEAIELAKMFGSADSYRFINSVLDKMAQQLRTEELEMFRDQQAC